MTIRAVIVGIEKYADPALDVAAPAANAVAMARWAVASGIAPADIFLCVSTLDPALDAEIGALGIPNRGCRRDDIETALRTGLSGAEAGSGLLFYWSGHGMVDSKGQRLFVCADYAPALIDRVFNASLFLRELRTDAFPGYRRQLILADVCGTNSQMPVRPTDYDPGAVHKRNQMVYFATPEGGYALASTGEGAFTFHALQVLKRAGGFPDFAAFRSDLDAELKASSLPRFLVDGRAEDTEWQERVGRAVKSDDEGADRLIELLVRLDIRHKDAESSFRATVATIKNPRLLAAQGLTGMVRELSGLRDPAPLATHGLVQFVLRLQGALPAHATALDGWIGEWAHKDTVNFESSQIEQERGRSSLLVDVVTGTSGEITALEPVLRSLDLTQPRGPGLTPIAVGCWEDVEAGLPAILRQVEEQGFHDLEVHFIVDAAVFDRPFHQLKDPNDELLGQTYGVLLHHRVRVELKGSTFKRLWRDRADAVRSAIPHSMTWTRCTDLQPLPSSADLCLVAWLPTASGKKRLFDLIKIGVPFIYWPHADGEPDAEPGLTASLGKLGDWSAMGDKILVTRISNPTFSGSLLWDDGSFRPFGG